MMDECEGMHSECTVSEQVGALMGLQNVMEFHEMGDNTRCSQKRTGSDNHMFDVTTWFSC
jgi:hypothetical protein